MYNETEFHEFIEDLNSKFKYRKDDEKYGFNEVWTKLPDNYEGDCEDYSLTVRDKFGGDLYFVKCYGGGHCILELPCGRFIDNIQQKRVTREYLEKCGYEFQYKYGFFRRNIKLIQGYLTKLWVKITK